MKNGIWNLKAPKTAGNVEPKEISHKTWFATTVYYQLNFRIAVFKICYNFIKASTVTVLG